MSTFGNKLLQKLVDAPTTGPRRVTGKALKYIPGLTRKERDHLVELLVREDMEAQKRASSEFKHSEGPLVSWSRDRISHGKPGELVSWPQDRISHGKPGDS